VDWNIEKYDSVSSTQDVARQFAREGAREGTVVLAKQQLQGRGRGGRKWCSPRGSGLWATIVLRPDTPPVHLPLLSVLVSVAIARAVESLTGSDVFIKWPNDVFMRGRKLAGVLCEAESDPGKGVSVVLAGFGLNLREPEGGFEREIAGLATSLETETGNRIEDEIVLDSILAVLGEMYGRFLEGRGSDIVEEATSRNLLIGKVVKVKVGDEVVEGKALGLTERGGLLIREDGGSLVEITSGEILDHTPIRVD